MKKIFIFLLLTISFLGCGKHDGSFYTPVEIVDNFQEAVLTKNYSDKITSKKKDSLEFIQETIAPILNLEDAKELLNKHGHLGYTKLGQKYNISIGSNTAKGAENILKVQLESPYLGTMYEIVLIDNKIVNLIEMSIED